MKQAIMPEPGRIDIRQVDRPAVGEDEVLLRIRRIGVCGSDVHVWHGDHPYTSYPVVQGHEFAGEVVEVGSAVRGVEPGTRATALPQRVCGECPSCRRGQWHICENLKVRGFQAPGCAQEYFAVPAERLVPLPDSFTYEQGAMVEPVAVAVHAAARAGDLAGQKAVVLGAGPIGNLVAQVAQAQGADVLITDLSRHRLQVAEQCGLQNVSDAGRESLAQAAGRCFDQAGFLLAWECAGAEATVNQAIETAAKGATIVVVGVFAERASVDLGLVQDRELTLRGTLMYQKSDYEKAVRLIAEGSINLQPLMSGHFNLEQYEEAYRAIDRQGEQLMKVFVDL
ncbi:MAG: zinc-dependent alcohol dehydrogenase [Phycisphaerae bacterium]